MINVGVIGLGMMGLTHLDVYAKRSDVNVVAISDKDPQRLSGKTRAVGNVEGQAQGSFNLSHAKPYEEGMDLIKDKSVELVDICSALVSTAVTVGFLRLWRVQDLNGDWYCHLQSCHEYSW